MKRVLCLCCIIFVLSGCAVPDRNMTKVLQLREQLIQGNGCAFQGEIVANYGAQIQRFAVECRSDGDGNLQFTVIAPESISGISGEIRSDGGRLTFDDVVLGFPLLADGMLSPVSAPWVFLKALRSGYITSCGKTETGIQVNVNDSYAENALALEIWLNEDETPTYAEIIWQDSRVLSITLEDFQIL